MSVPVPQSAQEPAQFEPSRQSARRDPGGEGTHPTLRDMITLQAPFGVKIAPGSERHASPASKRSNWVAALVRTTNWQENRYDDLCYVYDPATGAAFPLTRTGSIRQLEWVDGENLAVLKEGPDDDGKAQVWLYEGLVGEGWPVTQHKTGVDWFKPFAGGFLFRAKDPKREEKEARSGRFGKYTHLEQEESPSALYYVGLEEMRRYRERGKAATEKEAKKLVEPIVELSRLLPERLAIREVVPSPTDDAVYLTCWPREDLVYWRDTRVYQISLDAPAALAEHVRGQEAKAAEDGEDAQDRGEGTEKPEEDLSYLGLITRLNSPRGAEITAIAPDGRTLLVLHRGRDDKMYTREDLWAIDLQMALQAGDAEAFLAAMHNLTAGLDRTLLEWHWVEGGLFAAYVDGTRLHLARLGGEGPMQPLDLDGVHPSPSFHVSPEGRVALIGANATTYPEVYLAEPGGEGSAWRLQRLSDFGRAVEGWELGTVETIRWRSKDGAEIEGVLRKPAGFDPSRRYPLVFVVHGGPTWFSADYLLIGEDRAYYPAVQFVNKGILVLKPNYRGSIGRGQAFLDLNVDNLGIGDLWDLEGAIDHLVEQGWVDPERVGCMGWSQGGYISAFAGLHSDRFAAVSVGAGIADWYTYHISNDIPDFTVDYLSSSPFRDRERYVKTAPISNLASASTPMLIQHGSEDRRVPLSNAMELYRGLQEMGVPVELFVFPGMGHPITKPRENHAVMHQNLAWFSHYLLGEELSLE
jgi:dipeptidyl aminopeptidase/acylaminoacyl peptidase